MSRLSAEAYQKFARYLSIGNASVKIAQEENRRLGIPNWYSINGVIISDQELAALAKKRNSFFVKIINIFK
ncbi:MAG: hypothetical protein Q7V63_08890 [Gammaproteobacteria bacterium]|nr:hypothetical protein [Gammaproteobacteria bacterium]